TVCAFLFVGRSLRQRGPAMANSAVLVQLADALAAVSQALRQLADDERPTACQEPPANQKDQPDQTLVLTRAQAAKRLSSSTRTVDRLIADGDLAALKRGRFVRIAAGEVERFAQNTK